jgi:hypothetical protein
VGVLAEVRKGRLRGIISSRELPGTRGEGEDAQWSGSLYQSNLALSQENGERRSRFKVTAPNNKVFRRLNEDFASGFEHGEPLNKGIVMATVEDREDMRGHEYDPR